MRWFKLRCNLVWIWLQRQVGTGTRHRNDDLIKMLRQATKVIDIPPDPVKHCQVYRHAGCAHVDGMLCDMRTCTIKVTLKITPNDIKELENGKT